MKADGRIKHFDANDIRMSPNFTYQIASIKPKRNKLNKMKHIKILLGLVLLGAACCGYDTVKQMQPNGWNLTFCQPADGNKDGQQIAVGISGALPMNND